MSLLERGPIQYTDNNQGPCNLTRREDKEAVSNYFNQLTQLSEEDFKTYEAALITCGKIAQDDAQNRTVSIRTLYSNGDLSQKLRLSTVVNDTIDGLLRSHLGRPSPVAIEDNKVQVAAKINR